MRIAVMLVITVAVVTYLHTPLLAVGAAFGLGIAAYAVSVGMRGRWWW
jgi:hypothetical protein